MFAKTPENLMNSHSQTLPRGAVWSRLRWRLKSKPARSCRRCVLSMTSALSGSRKRWSLPSAGPSVLGTRPTPSGPDRAVNIFVLPISHSLRSFSSLLLRSADNGDSLSDRIPVTLRYISPISWTKIKSNDRMRGSLNDLFCLLSITILIVQSNKPNRLSEYTQYTRRVSVWIIRSVNFKCARSW